MNKDDRNKLRDALSSAVQEALLSAAEKAVGPVRKLRVDFGFLLRADSATDVLVPGEVRTIDGMAQDQPHSLCD